MVGRGRKDEHSSVGCGRMTEREREGRLVGFRVPSHPIYDGTVCSPLSSCSLADAKFMLS